MLSLLKSDQCYAGLMVSKRTSTLGAGAATSRLEAAGTTHQLGTNGCAAPRADKALPGHVSSGIRGKVHHVGQHDGEFLGPTASDCDR